ncbi:hypothetical protein LWX64_002654 [Enterococcus faecalis]|nr:hypothetical protein [Enterococcus faecalis]
MSKLVTHTLDQNFKYHTDKKYIFHWDNILTYLKINNQSKKYLSNYQLRMKLLQLVFWDDTGYIDKEIHNYYKVDLEGTPLTDIIEPDYFTYLVGAFANLTVLYKSMVQFVITANLKNKLDQQKLKQHNTFINTLKLIRNKLLIHPEENNTLIDIYSDMNSCLDFDIFSKSFNLSVYHKGGKKEFNLIESYNKIYLNLLIYFMDIMILNQKNLVQKNFLVKDRL